MVGEIKMKLLILIGLLIFNSVNASEVCDKYSILAGEVMEARQLGIDIVEVVHLVPNYKDLVVYAYSFPKWDSEERQQEEIGEFKVTAYLACDKKFPDDKKESKK